MARQVKSFSQGDGNNRKHRDHRTRKGKGKVGDAGQNRKGRQIKKFILKRKLRTTE